MSPLRWRKVIELGAGCSARVVIYAGELAEVRIFGPDRKQRREARVGWTVRGVRGQDPEIRRVLDQAVRAGAPQLGEASR